MSSDASVIERLIEQVEQRYRDLTEELADPETISNRARYTEVARSHRELDEAHQLAERYRRAESDAAGAEELLEAGDGSVDADERRELLELIASSRAEMDQIAEELRLAMVERDPNDA